MIANHPKRRRRQAISIEADTPYTHAWLAHAYAGLNDEKAARQEVAALMQLDAAMAKEIEQLIEEKLRIPLPNIDLSGGKAPAEVI